MSAGIHVMLSWLSTPLEMGAIAYVIAPFAIWEKILREDDNVPFPDDYKLDQNMTLQPIPYRTTRTAGLEPRSWAYR